LFAINKPYKHKILFNPTLLYLRQANLAYEYRFNRSESLELLLGIVYNGKRKFILDDDPTLAEKGGEGMSNMPETGQLIRVTYKRYFSEEFYYAPVYQIKHYTYENGIFGEPRFTNWGSLNENRFVNSISLHAGITESVGRFVLDGFWGVGLQMALRNLHYLEYYDRFEGPTKNACPCEPKRFFSRTLSINLGFKVGYQFGPITEKYPYFPIRYSL
jgi:hypothetical protein